jgi:hypothetical protein
MKTNKATAADRLKAFGGDDHAYTADREATKEDQIANDAGFGATRQGRALLV